MLATFQVLDQRIKNVTEFRYLRTGTIETRNHRNKSRAELEGQKMHSFNNLSRVLKNRTLSLKLWMRIMRCNAWSVGTKVCT